MYPSGAWRGYWEQTTWGRQPMHNLVLRFADGTIRGDGVDIIGRFVFQGQYDDSGNVALVKHYAGQHSVRYQGHYDGEGTIYGTWSILSLWSGPFALSPERFEVPADAPILTIAAEPES
jgi:hypothetical protein